MIGVEREVPQGKTNRGIDAVACVVYDIYGQFLLRGRRMSYRRQANDDTACHDKQD